MARDLFDLTGKVAVVTGGTRGIGAELCLGMMDYGATVVPVGRTEQTVQAFRERLGERAKDIFATAADVTKAEEIERLRQAVLERHGRVDIVVANAGVNRLRPILENTEEDWDYVVGPNLKGMFMTCRIFAETMAEQQSGKIINIASAASLVAFPNAVPYAASKGGVITMTRSLAFDLAKHNIQVNAIAPGFFKTDLNRETLAQGGREEKVLAATPARRLGRLEELSGACVYLASRASDFVTGHTMVVDGGLTMAGFSSPPI